MQKIAIIPISEAGSEVASKLKRELGASTLPRTDVGQRWNDFDAFIFIGAMGICVRTIAPYVKDKHEDPAVVCVDSLGQHAISVLSGHIGGANDLTRTVSGILGAASVITTQSDNAGLWALDTLAARFNWTLVAHASQRDIMQSAIIAFVNRKPTALLIEAHDAGTEYLLNSLPEHVTVVSSLDEVDQRYKLLIVVSPRLQRLEAFLDEPSGRAERPTTLQFVPRVLTIGFGLAHQAGPAETIYNEMEQAIMDRDIYPCARQWCTIDVKANEPFVALLSEKGETVRFFTAEELAAVDVPNPSETVEKHVGTPSVCEAAAILGSNHGKLIIPKVKGKNWTAALAIDHSYLRPQTSDLRPGHIEIVGAGPGDPDLISVRGRKMLEKADLILYAGSLVPKALTDCHKPGAVVRSSADMTLEEQCALMKEHYDRGHFIVRLHTGDPCIFGAIQEQMAYFDQNGMSYHITPGISSFLAAAAELRSQFTIPERTQTIILTRGEGRTPMPEKEQLHLLARSQSTMCIFLSAAIVDDVQRELLQEYPEDTPVAACYHLTWPDQKIYRGVLKDLAKIVHDNHFTLTTMLVVGEAIDNRQGLSELYNKHFTHLFRKGDKS
ncbi:MAG: precorrin-4 C(11)-methyltransferase [Prevotella sp.]|nr:precorrin-4 C(11)-methyltransferase [Prevotella sp.]MBR6189351.1 precorrin-4 C(11)-methyltransferase [Prevotella sp.]